MKAIYSSFFITKKNYNLLKLKKFTCKGLCANCI